MLKWKLSLNFILSAPLPSRTLDKEFINTVERLQEFYKDTLSNSNWSNNKNHDVLPDTLLSNLNAVWISRILWWADS